jgi:predicted transcriptional regulator
MSNTTNLENDFKERLTEACDKFSKWMESSNTILDTFNAVKENLKTVEELDSAMVEVTKVTDKTADELSEELEESFSDLEKDRIVSVDTFEIDLKEKGIDVSEWEEPVKPVKAIVSVVTRDSDERYGLSMTMGNMIMLMEDGTFRMNQ